MLKKIDNIYMYILAALVGLGFFVSLVFFLLNNTENVYKDLINNMVNVLINCFVWIVGYYWGSSKGSADKNEFLKKE